MLRCRGVNLSRPVNMPIRDSHIREKKPGAIVMEFRSNKLICIAAGVITGFIGVFNLMLYVTFSDQGAPSFLGVLGGIFIIISITAFTFRKIVRIEKEGVLVERAIGAFFWKKVQLIPVGDFNGIGITTGSRSTTYSGPTTIYFVQLLGRKNISIPGSSPDLDTVLSTARQISGFMNLPIDETPRIRLTVFGW